MAVPRKPKKLDRRSEKTADTPVPRQTAPQTDGAGAKDTASAEKLDAALEIVEKLDGRAVGKDPASGGPEPAHPGTGFRWQVSLTALMDEEEEERSASTPLLEVGFTFPFFWNVPIWGEMMRQYVRGLKAVKPPRLFF